MRYMKNIEYSSEDYKVIETEEMNDELHFKLVQFNTGYYGIISHNPTNNKEKVILLSPEKDKRDNLALIFGGLGCKSFMVFANDAKRYLEKAPIELVVKLGKDAPTEYREAITRDQAKTLYQKVEICHEIMSMKIEDSFHYNYRDLILFVLLGIIISSFIVAIVNTLHALGVI